VAALFGGGLRHDLAQLFQKSPVGAVRVLTVAADGVFDIRGAVGAEDDDI